MENACNLESVKHIRKITADSRSGHLIKSHYKTKNFHWIGPFKKLFLWRKVKKLAYEGFAKFLMKSFMPMHKTQKNYQCKFNGMYEKSLDRETTTPCTSTCPGTVSCNGLG